MIPNLITIQLSIDAKGIVEFNQNLGSGTHWGSFDDPFDAIQFLTVSTPEIPRGSTDNIPLIYPSSQVNISIEFIPPGEGYQVEMDHFKLIVVGRFDYYNYTPRSLWRDLIDLDATDGAVAADGNFYLGETEENVFSLTTSDVLNDTSPNLNYSFRFVIKKEGMIRYCQIDPLIKTSSEDI